MTFYAFGGFGTTITVQPMQRGDMYRRRAQEMLFVASQSRRFREQFVSLAAALVRLAEQADRNEQVRTHL